MLCKYISFQCYPNCLLCFLSLSTSVWFLWRCGPWLIAPHSVWGTKRNILLWSCYFRPRLQRTVKRFVSFVCPKVQGRGKDNRDHNNENKFSKWGRENVKLPQQQDCRKVRVAEWEDKRLESSAEDQKKIWNAQIWKKTMNFRERKKRMHIIRINFHLPYSYVPKGAPKRSSNLANVSFVFKHQLWFVIDTYLSNITFSITRNDQENKLSKLFMT